MELDTMVSIFADLSGQVAETNKYMSRLMPPYPRPNQKPVGNSIVATGVSPQLLQIDITPSSEYMWYVKQIGIFGTDGHTALSGVVADVYLGPVLDYAPGVPITAFDAQLLSGILVPSIYNFGHKDKPVQPREHVYAWVYGLTLGQPVELVAQVDEYRVEEMERMTI
jgi:hypothetical protein